jgi:hypothetical protein
MLEFIAGLMVGLILAVLLLMIASVFIAYVTQASYVDDHEFDDPQTVSYNPDLEKR